MAERSQRDAFFGRLAAVARADPSVVVVTADMGAPALDEFRRDLAPQFVNVGIAEQNAVAVGTGLALAGRKPFVFAIAPFVTLRCLEQVRVTMGIIGAPVTLVGVGAGFSYEESGPTHHLLEDFAALRALPRLRLHSVTDAAMAEGLADLCCRDPRPRYLRLDRQLFPDRYAPGDDLSAGLRRLRDGADVLLIGTGAMTHAALEAGARLAARGVAAGVLDAHTFPLDAARLVAALGTVRRVVTLEEHFLPGGLGSAVAEIAADRGLDLRLLRLGADPARGYSYVYGGRERIREAYGLDLPGIERAVLAHLETWR